MVKDLTANSGDASFQDWIPVRVYGAGRDLAVDWCYADKTRFTHPFFSDTLRHILRRPFSSLFTRSTPLESLDGLTEPGAEMHPTGFIFHMSRCGSTLVAQMLAAVDRNLVISEAPPIDDVLASTRACDDATRGTYFKSIVRALGRRRNRTEQNYFVKFDSWNTVDLDLITKVFPDVPWIFLYRDPVEVIVSQMRQRGSQMVPGAIDPLVPGLSRDASLKMSPEHYCGRVLARTCEVASHHASDGNCLLVNYSQLPDAVLTSISRHFEMAWEPAEIDAMRRAAKFDAKTPRLYFESDTETKQFDATDAVREAAKLVQPAYDKLETIRRKREEDF